MKKLLIYLSLASTTLFIASCGINKKSESNLQGGVSPTQAVFKIFVAGFGDGIGEKRCVINNSGITLKVEACSGLLNQYFYNGKSKRVVNAMTGSTFGFEHLKDMLVEQNDWIKRENIYKGIGKSACKVGFGNCPHVKQDFAIFVATEAEFKNTCYTLNGDYAPKFDPCNRQDSSGQVFKINYSKGGTSYQNTRYPDTYLYSPPAGTRLVKFQR